MELLKNTEYLLIVLCLQEIKKHSHVFHLHFLFQAFLFNDPLDFLERYFLILLWLLMLFLVLIHLFLIFLLFFRFTTRGIFRTTTATSFSFFLIILLLFIWRRWWRWWRWGRRRWGRRWRGIGTTYNFLLLHILLLCIHHVLLSPHLSAYNLLPGTEISRYQRHISDSSVLELMPCLVHSPTAHRSLRPFSACPDLRLVQEMRLPCHTLPLGHLRLLLIPSTVLCLVTFLFLFPPSSLVLVHYPSERVHQIGHVSVGFKYVHGCHHELIFFPH